MIDVIWSVYTALAWVVVTIWMIPTIVAHRRSHRNTTAIFVFSIIFSVIPSTALSLLGYILVLGFSLYRSPETVVVKGPKGDPGTPGLTAYQEYVKISLDKGNGSYLSEEAWLESLRGKDADEIPLSKNGVVRPRAS